MLIYWYYVPIYKLNSWANFLAFCSWYINVVLDIFMQKHWHYADILLVCANILIICAIYKLSAWANFLAFCSWHISSPFFFHFYAIKRRQTKKKRKQSVRKADVGFFKSVSHRADILASLQIYPHNVPIYLHIVTICSMGIGYRQPINQHVVLIYRLGLFLCPTVVPSESRRPLFASIYIAYTSASRSQYITPLWRCENISFFWRIYMLI